MDEDDRMKNQNKDIDYVLALSYVVKDADWIKKLLIGGVLYALSVFVLPGFFVTGYLVKNIRSVAAGEEQALPEWDDWGALLGTGLKLSLAEYVYLLPFFFLTFVYFFYVGFFLISTLFSSGSQSAPSVLTAALWPLQFILPLVFMIVAVLTGLWIFTVEIRFAEKGNIGSCFEFRALFDFIRENAKDYLLIYAVLYGINYVAGLGMLFFFVGVFFTTFYAQLVGSHLKGQLLRKALARRQGEQTASNLAK